MTKTADDYIDELVDLFSIGDAQDFRVRLTISAFIISFLGKWGERNDVHLMDILGILEVSKKSISDQAGETE